MRKSYIVISHIQIQNANAMSSCYTIGFPAMTAWLGAVHAWQRLLNRVPGLERLVCVKTAVISHQCQLQVYKEGRFKIQGTANPLKRNKKTGNFERPPFIEEARIHLDVSLVVEVSGLSSDTDECCKTNLQTILLTTKLASGDVVSYQDMDIYYITEEDTTTERKILRRLMPGYALIERSDLLLAAANSQEDMLESLLDYLSIHVYGETDEAANTIEWQQQKREPGWLVPIAIGFKGISPLGHVEMQRDAAKEHCFVESVVTLGEFKMTYRFQHVEDMMWHYVYDAMHQWYLCKNEAGGMNHG